MPRGGGRHAEVAPISRSRIGLRARWRRGDVTDRSDATDPEFAWAAVLTASAALLRADGPRALEQATAELIGAELRNPEVQGLRFDLWAHDLIESARNRVLSDVAWNNGTWQEPWWLMPGLASIGSYGLGGYAAQQAAEAAKSLPRAVLAQQPDWLALMPGTEATGDMHVLRDVYGTRFGVIAGFAYPAASIRRSICSVSMPASTSAWPPRACSTTRSRRSPRGGSRSATARQAWNRSPRKCWPGCHTRSTPRG